MIGDVTRTRLKMWKRLAAENQEKEGSMYGIQKDDVFVKKNKEKLIGKMMAQNIRKASLEQEAIWEGLF